MIAMAAHGFCGSYVGPAGQTPTNGSSRIVVANSGEISTVTMTSDAKGVPREFGLLIPVPADTTEEDIKVITDLTMLEELDRFTAPRVVSYTCDDIAAGAATASSSGPAGGCNDGGCTDMVVDQALDKALDVGIDALEAAVPGVDVLGLFTEGDLELSVLDATNADALQEWLGANGYGSVSGANALLQGYIDQDVHFVAAKATMPVVGRDAWIDPVQITYTSKTQMLPLRLGSLNADGNDQELTLWVLSDEADGEARITTFPEADMESDCMPDKGSDVVGVFEEAFDQATKNGDGAWVTEFSWPTSQHCDPCAEGAVDPGPFVAELGGPSGNAHITRMRMRFDPGALREDLAFQFTNTNPTRQLVYIEHRNELEDEFPICFEGFTDDPRGTCEDEWTDTSTARLPMWSLLMLPLVGWSMRRRGTV